MKGRQGIVAGYNAQAMVSATKTEEGTSGMLVTAVDVVDQANDNSLLAPMVEQSEETTGTKSQMTLADAGYFSASHLVVTVEASRWWCQRHGNGSSKTRITRTDSPMTSTATALRVHRDRRSRLSVYSMRTESHCDCTGLPAPSVRHARPSEPVPRPGRSGEAWP